MSGEKKRILLVEDEVIIALDEAQTLRDYGFDVVTAHSGQHAIDAVTDESMIDLILMDIDLGKGMDGTTAAQMILKNHDIPVIFLSSHTEPEVVNKTEKITSYGYVVKRSGETILIASIKMAFRLHEAHQIIKVQNSAIETANARLSSTIEDLQASNEEYEALNEELVISQKEIAQTNEALLVSEAKHRILLEESSDPIFSFRKDGTYLFVNKAFAAPFGKEPADIIGKRIWDIFPQEEADKRYATVNAAFESRETQVIEVMVPGDRYFITTAKPVTDEQNNAVQVICISKEITEWKRAEKALIISEEYQRIIINNSPFGTHFYALDRQDRLIFEGANTAADKILSFNHADLIGKSVEEAFPGLVGTEIPERYRSIALTGGKYDLDSVAYDEGAISGAFEIHAFRTVPRKMAVFFVDITKRKQLEAQIQKSADEFRTTFEQAAVGIAHISTSGKFTYVNSKMCSITGYAKDELVSMTFRDITHPDDLQEDISNIQKMNDGVMKELSRDKRYIHKDGHIIWIRVTVSAHHNEKGTIEYLISVVEDISKQKEIEQSLREANEQFSIVSENVDDVIWIYDLVKNKLTYSSPSVFTLRGYTPEEVCNRSMADILPDYSAPLANKYTDEMCNEMIATGKKTLTRTHTIDQNHKDGHIIHTEIVVTLVADEIGKPSKIVGVTRNITDTVRIESELRKQKSLLDRAQQIAKIGYWEFDLADGSFHGSPHALQIYGIDNTVTTVNEVQTVPLAQYRPLLDEQMKKLVESNIPYDVEFEIRRANDGAVLHIHSIAEYNPLENKVFGVIQDISDYKNFDIALRQSEERYKKITSTVLDYIYTVTVKNGGAVKTYHAPGCVGVTGFSSEEYAADPNLWYSMVHPDDRLLVEEKSRGVLAGIVPDSFEHRIYRKDGILRWVRNTPVAHYDSSGNLTSYDGLIQDITEQKNVEEALRQNEMKFRRLVEGMRDILWEMDPSLNFTYINPIDEQLRGYKPEEVIGHSLWEFITPDSLEPLQETSKIFAEQIINHTLPGYMYFVCEQFCKDRSTIWLEVIATPIFDASGNVTSYQGIARDITQRRKDQEALNIAVREKEALYSELNHRVKNSLAMIVGLIGLELHRITEPAQKETLGNLKNRVVTISNLYSMLSAKEEGEDLRLDVYLGNIINSLSEAYILDSKEINIRTEMDQLSMDVKRTATIGLILNELLTNTLKYSFPQKKGDVLVKLAVTRNEIVLEVSNDGTALPDNFDINNSKGLGMKIVQMLAKQMGAKVAYSSGKRTSFSVHIPNIIDQD